MNVPPGHSVQVTLPVTLAKRPTGHTIHAVSPVTSLYWPTGHDLPTGDVSPTPHMEPGGARHVPLQPVPTEVELGSVPKVVCGHEVHDTPVPPALNLPE